MKVCTETHHEPSFGEITEGSLWDDDSPYLLDPTKFADAEPEPEKSSKKPKGGAK